MTDKEEASMPQPSQEDMVRFDKIVKAVDERFDVRGSILAALVHSCLDNNGTIKDSTRMKFEVCVTEGVYDFIEQCARETVGPRERWKLT